MSQITDEQVADGQLDAGINYAIDRLCEILDVDPKAINWDAATETMDGDVCSVICNVLVAAYGEEWSSKPEDTARIRSALSTPPVGAETVAWQKRHLIAQIGGERFSEWAFCSQIEHARILAHPEHLDYDGFWAETRPLFAAPPRSDKANGDWKGANYAAEARKLMAEAKDRVKPIVGGPEGETIIAYEIPTGLWLMLQAHVRNLLDTLPTSPAVPNTVGEDK